MSLVKHYYTSSAFSSLKAAAGLLLCALATCALSASLVPPAQAQDVDFLVDTTDDNLGGSLSVSDPDPDDCGPASNGDECSLREAIEAAEQDGGGVVGFAEALNGKTITLNFDSTLGLDLLFGNGGTLSVDGSAVTIDGTTAAPSSDGPAVEIDGSNLPEDDGLVGNILETILVGEDTPPPHIRFEEGSDGSTVRGLALTNGANGSAIVAGEGAGGGLLGLVSDLTDSLLGLALLPNDAIPVNNLTIEQNFIGRNLANEGGNGNAGDGMRLLTGNSTITDNVVAGNDGNGIALASTVDGGEGSNEVRSNVIRGHGEEGLVLASSGNTVEDNDIAGNVGNEIRIIADNNEVLNNRIGTNNDAQDDVSSDESGLLVGTGADNDAGGAGNTIKSNIIGENNSFGIWILGGPNTGNTVVGNDIGTNPEGGDLGNGEDGILIGADDATVGSNVIGNNGRNGIRLDGANGSAIISNFIGTDPSLEANLGNDAAGILAKSNGGSQPVDNEIGIDEPSDESNELTGEDASPWAGDDANAIANNDGAGVAAEGDPSDLSIRGNMINDNTGAPINLPMPKLPVDVPTIEGTSIVGESQNQVQVTYAVREPEGADPSYPITVDFYRVDAEGEPEAYLGNDKYEQSDFDGSCGIPPCPTTVTLDPDTAVTGSSGQSSSKVDGEPARVAATSTDKGGNTSELSGQNRLPVEMAGLEALQSGSSVELTWQTASETNNAGFNVQLETEEGSWTTLGFVESRANGGTTTETQSYRYTVDRDLEPGTHRFRLQQTDLDGSSTLTEPVSVDVQMQRPATLRAPAPNPVSSSAAVSFAVKKQAEATIQLYNTLGQQVATVYEGTPAAGESQTARIEATDLPSGVYFLRLEADGRVRTERMTVVR